MVDFIKRLLLFLSLILMHFGLVYWLNSRNAEKHFPIIKVKNLFIGDSHFAKSIDDRLIENSKNIAIQAEPYIATYYKLKAILKHNPEIERIFLSLSYNNLTQKNEILFSTPDFAQYVFQMFYPVWSIGDLHEIEFNSHIYYSILLRNFLLFPKKNHFQSFLGFFNPDTSGEKKIGLQSSLDRHFFFQGKNVGTSPISKKYLVKIIELAKKKNKPIELIVTPLHPGYVDAVPESHKKFFNEVLSEVGDSVKIHNYRDLFSEDKYFYDYDHVNTVGAKHFSEKIQRDLFSK